MFIIRWWRFLRGYVVITLQGRGVERLLNLAISRGIGFWDLRKQKDQARLSLDLASFRALRPLVRQARCRLRIRQKAGLPFIKFRLRRRWGLAAGAVIFVASLYLATSFVWYIRVAGTERLDQAEVLALAEELGLRRGVWKRGLDLVALAEELPRRNSTICWAALRLRGILLEIEIVEHLAGTVADDRPADLVAAKDGLIERIAVIEGRAAVKVGDTVTRGELLIEGLASLEGGILNPEEMPPPQEVHARGKVEARVWYEVRKPLQLVEITSTLTGRSRRSIHLQLKGGRQWRLWGPRENPYPNVEEEARLLRWSWRNRDLPVELQIIRYREQEIQQRTVSHDEAASLARERAAESLRLLVPAEIEWEQLYFEEYMEDEAGWVRAVAETREEIGMVKLRRP